MCLTSHDTDHQFLRLSVILGSTEKEIIISLLPIVLDNNRAPHLSHFLRFLESCAHQRITLDQWDSFLQFNSAVSVDLSNLEEDGACKSRLTCNLASGAADSWVVSVRLWDTESVLLSDRRLFL